MIFTKAMEYEEIKKDLNKDDTVTIVGCSMCARLSGSGGEEKMKELALKLREDGYDVKDGYMLAMVCSPKALYVKPNKGGTTLISLSCSAGTSNIKRYFADQKIIEATKDIGLAVTDTDKKITKVTLPYESCKEDDGKEYKLHTGEKMDSDDNLLTEEVKK